MWADIEFRSAVRVNKRNRSGNDLSGLFVIVF